MNYKVIKNRIQAHVIEDAIADFEKQVDFEFIPVITPKSSYVEHISWILSLLFLLLFIALIDFLFATQWHDSWFSPLPFYIASPFVAVVLGSLLDHSDLVDRFFISKKERVRQVQEKAERFFFQHRLHELKSQNALLLFISVMERQIVIFHDPRMSSTKIQQIDQDLLKILQQAFKHKNFQQGLLNAIAHLKKELAPHFPPLPSTSSENFLPNKIIWQEDTKNI